MTDVTQQPELWTKVRCSDLRPGDLVSTLFRVGVSEHGHLTGLLNIPTAKSILLFTHHELHPESQWVRSWFLHGTTGVACFRYEERAPQFFIIARLEHTFEASGDSVCQ